MADHRYAGGASRRGRIVATVVALAIVAVACGGGSTDDAAPTSAAELVDEVSATPDATDLTSQLDFLGEMADAPSEPVSDTFDSAGGTLDLPDGAVIDVPPGAFESSVQVTAVVVDLDLGRYIDDAPWGHSYVVATEQDVEPAEPVVIEIPRPPESLRATQLVDGEWVVIDLPAGATTRIPINHFSSVPTVVVEVTDGDPAEVEARADGEAPKAFLITCLFAVGGPVLDEGEYATALAFSICTQALVARFTPLGEHVSVACVGDKIGGDADLLGAIDACVTEDDNKDEGESVSGEDTVPEPEPSEPAEGQSGDIGPLAWDGVPTLAPDSHLTQHGDAWISLTRTPGTNDFSVAVKIGTTADHEFLFEGVRDPVACVSITTKTFEGEGSLDPEIPDRLLLSGEIDLDIEYDCDGVAENDRALSSDLLMLITSEGLVGNFEGFDYALDGVPILLEN